MTRPRFKLYLTDLCAALLEAELCQKAPLWVSQRTHRLLNKLSVSQAPTLGGQPSTS